MTDARDHEASQVRHVLRQRIKVGRHSGRLWQSAGMAAHCGQGGGGGKLQQCVIKRVQSRLPPAHLVHQVVHVRCRQVGQLHWRISAT